MDDRAKIGRVCIFAKAPRLGAVKTRLAADIGDRAALDIYRRMLWRYAGRLSAGPWHLTFAVTPDAAAADDAIWPDGIDRVPQGGGDLGARMLRALAGATPIAPVVVVGSDIPDLDAGHIARAFAALRRSRIVFGPSEDGGFYLVGASAPQPPGFFVSVAWSHPTTLAEAIATCDASSPPALIDMLDDFDDMRALGRHPDDRAWTDLLET